MKIADRLLLLALAVVILLMAILVAAPNAADRVEGDPESALAGEPREVDVDLLRRRLIRGELSDREALYYR